jgi:hypothetical protein
MKEHIEQRLDSLAKKVIKETSLESPSKDFTSNIMAQLDNISIESVTTYKPLISKKVWFVFTIAILGGFIYTLIDGGLQSMGWFESIDLSVISNNKFVDAASSITISKILMYAVALFGLFWFAQIGIIKNHLEKQLNY